MKRILSYILLILCVLSTSEVSLAQQAEGKSRISELDSLLQVSAEIDQIPILCELSDLYLHKNTAKSLSYLKSADKLSSKNNANPLLSAKILDAYGNLYFAKKDYNSSIASYEKASELFKKAGSNIAMCHSLFNVGIAQKAAKKYAKANLAFNKSLSIAKKQGDYSMLVLNYLALYETATLAKDFKNAVTYYNMYVKAATNSKKLSSELGVITSTYKGEKRLAVLDEDEMIDNQARLLEMDSALVEAAHQNFELEQQAVQRSQAIDSLSQEAESQSQQLQISQEANNENQILINYQRQLINAFIIIGVIVLALLGVMFFLFRKIKKTNRRLENQNSEIEDQRKLIQVKNDQITDSINYARKIQDSILVPENKIKRWLPDMFIYYKPKDIVSGDFYWFSKYESKYVVTAIDCTGHGVPGAFLSMIGNTLLHEIVNIKHVFKPDQILSMLHTGITLALNQESEDTDSEDGMDMSLCTVDTKLNRFQFAGAKNSLYVVQGDKLKILKANYYSIGGKPLRPDMKVAFTCYDFMYDDNTSIYMFSDGYLDQFGGSANEKFNAQRFKELIIENRNLPMEKQKEIFTKTMEDWKGDRQQIDDFLVMGIKLSGIGKEGADTISDGDSKIIDVDAVEEE